MQYENHLKERSYYEDRYDRHTVEEGLEYEKMLTKLSIPKDVEKAESDRAKILVYNVSMWTFRGQRYLNRNKTIEEWMARDRKMDSIYENTSRPESVICKFCDTEMKLWHEWLNFDYKSNAGVMEFHYSCDECHVGKKVINNKVVEDIIPWKCPRCSQRMETNSKRVKKKIICNDNCKFCGYKKVTEVDLSAKKEPIVLPNAEQEKQYRIDKDRLCLSDKEGQEYALGMANIKRINELIKETKPVEKAPAKVLNLENVKKLLIKELKVCGFIKFKMGRVEVKQGMAVDFSVHDEKNRHSNQARLDLNKSIKEILQDTNWHLMTEGSSGYLGMLKGRLRGIESNSHIYNRDGEIITL